MKLVRSKSIYFFVMSLTSISLVLLFQNCGVSKPSVELSSFAKTGYAHTGSETSCSTCHETQRPVSTTGFLNLNANTPFDYATHGSGFDCVTCHNMTQPTRTSADWAQGSFVHTAMISSCVSCHTSQRPTAIVSGFNHATSGTGDCIACHQKSMSSNFDSLADWAGAVGTPAANTYDSGHDVILNSYVPNFSNTTIQSLTTQSLTLHMSMNHTTTQVTAANLASCQLCHTGAAQGAYFPGNLHTSLDAAGIAQPLSCNECHSGASPSGFVGPNNATRSPQSPAMKHNAVAWTKSGANYVATTNALVITDCAVCHTSAPLTTSWSAALYHSNLSSHAMAQPSSCLDCHANSRPSGVVPAVNVSNVSAFDHINGGTGDCVSCHTSTSLWTNGKFHTTSSGTQTSCVSCHSSERPTNGNMIIGGTTTPFAGYDSVNKPFDLATHGGSLDCVTCHASPPANATIANWKSANFVHSASTTSCASCHSTQRPTNSASDLVRTGGFDHTINGVGECLGCHKATQTANIYTAMNNWAGGTTVPTGLVGSHKSSVTAIHLNYTATKITSTSLNTQDIVSQMLHSSTQMPASLTGGTHCVDCHSQANAGSYAGGVFHSVLTTKGLPQPTSCKDCHTGSLPIDIIGAGTVLGNAALKPMDHAATLSGGVVSTSMDCYACHTSTTSFTNAQFHNKIGVQTISNCTTCHYVVMPTSTTPLNKMVHVSTSVTQDCTSCHTTPTAGQIAAPASTNWGSSLFHNNVTTQPTACNECHSATLPATTTLSSNNAQYMSHTSAAASGKDCALCHTSDLALSPRAWSKLDKMHTVVTTTTCNGCHGLTNGNGAVAGTGNNIPAGLTNSHKLTTSSVAATNTYDQVTHTATDVSGKECNVCHTQVGATLTAGQISPAWNNASFHKNIANVTGQCVTCHANIKPNVVVSSFDHATITSDCSGCHSYPGTGTTTAGNWLGATDGGPHTYSFMSANAFTAKTANAPEKGCVSCHTLAGATTNPKGAPLSISIAKSSTAAVPATASTTTITFQHSFQATTGGTSANNFTACLGCHQTAATNALGPALNGMGIYDSTAGAKGSNGWGTLTATGPTGTFNHQIPTALTYSVTGVTTITASAAVNSCLPCHMNRGFGHGGDGHTIFKVGGCATGKSPQDCVQCHQANYTSWSNPKGNSATCK